MQPNFNNIIAFLQQNVVVYGVKLVAALAIFLVGRLGARTARAALGKLLTREKVDPTLIGFLGNVTYSAILVVVIVLALNQLGVQATSLIAVLGAASLAVGLSLQGSLSNFAAGILLIICRPIRIGDFIEAGGASGVVRDIEILNTRLASSDNKLITVPNSKIMGDKIVNHTALGTRRVELAGDRIRVNAVAPAVVETPVYETFMSPEQAAKTLPAFKAMHPLGRNGQPKDVAEAILFLASEQASWITGIVLPVDGGVTAGRP